MAIRTLSVTVTTAADGTAAANTPPVHGHLIAIIYTKVDYTNGVVFTITSSVTGQNLWVETAVNASKTVAPRQAVHDTVGAARLYAAAGEAVSDRIGIANEAILITLASGGNATSGTFRIIWDGV